MERTGAAAHGRLSVAHRAEGGQPGAVVVRRVRLREVPQLARLGARTMDRLARSGRLVRVGAIYPPAPVRLFTLTVLRAVNLAVIPSWVARTATDAATVSAYPSTGPGRYLWRITAGARLGGWLLAAVALATLALIRWPAAAPAVGALAVLGLVAVYAPFLWLARHGWADRGAGKVLREARDRAIADAPGLVLWGADLAGGGKGAGQALVASLVATADAEGITIAAFIEEAMADYYRQAGFRCEPVVPTSWGAQLLAVRPPRGAPRQAAGPVRFPRSWLAGRPQEMRTARRVAG